MATFHWPNNFKPVLFFFLQQRTFVFLTGVSRDDRSTCVTRHLSLVELVLAVLLSTLGSWKGFRLLAEVPQRWNHWASPAVSVWAPACCWFSSLQPWCGTPLSFSLSRCFAVGSTKTWNLQNHTFFCCCFIVGICFLPVMKTKSCLWWWMLKHKWE